MMDPPQCQWRPSSESEEDANFSNKLQHNSSRKISHFLYPRTIITTIGKPTLWRFSSIQLLNHLLVILLCSSLLPTAMSTAKSSPPESGLLRVETSLNQQLPTTTIPTINRPIPTISSSSSGSGTGSTPKPINTGTVTPVPTKQDKIGSIYLDNDDFDRLEDEEHVVNDRLALTKHRIPGGNGLLFDDSASSDHHHDDLKNDTRERDALQEEGSHHQPVVFIGGPGYIPPNNLRPRPVLEAEIPWPNRPVLDNAPRYPYPLQSAWDRNYRNPFNMTRVQHIEAECQDDFMKLRVSFNGSFQGLIYSSGFAYDNDCMYVNGTGRDYYEYLIRLNRCGTLGASNHAEGRKEPSKNFMWNTVTVQYNPLIEEEWDEHFKVTCEYGYDFWKTVTFKPFDVEVATGNPVVFTLTPPECYMEVRYGFGASGTRVGGPVRVGDPLTLMIYMRSQYDGFDLVVNDCYAHNGGTKKIQLIDHYGCPVDSKLMSPFRGTWSHTNVYETQVYAYLKTFRFTGSPALYIECDVRMCHGQCPSQPCYWRNVKNIQKRSVDNLDSEKNSTLSESINLSQALTVLQDKDEGLQLSSTDVPPDSVCFRTSVFTALFGFGTILLATLGMVSMITCYRLKRIKNVNDEVDSSDILRPYSHHINSPGSHLGNLPHHWSSSTTSSSSILSKPRVP